MTTLNEIIIKREKELAEVINKIRMELVEQSGMEVDFTFWRPGTGNIYEAEIKLYKREPS